MENINEEKNFHVSDLIKKIEIFLPSNKPADVLIIKSHLLCEYYMNHVLILKEVCSAKDIESQSFYHKIDRLKSVIDMQDENQKKTFEKICRLNKLRNKVGHELTYSLSESDVDSLGYLDGKQYILDKYNVETDHERLRNILISTVIGIAFVLMTMIRVAKQNKKENPDLTNDKNDSKV